MIAPNSNLRATSMRWITLLFWNTLPNQSSDQHVFLFVYTCIRKKQCPKYFLQQQICFRKTSGSNMGAQSNLVTPLVIAHYRVGVSWQTQRGSTPVVVLAIWGACAKKFGGTYCKIFFCVLMTSPCSLNRGMTFLHIWQNRRQWGYLPWRPCQMAGIVLLIQQRPVRGAWSRYFEN